MLGKDEGSRQQEPLWDAENRNVLVAPKVTLAINQGINCTNFSISPFVALYPRVFVFPTVTLLGPFDIQFLIAIFVRCHHL